MGGAPVIRAGGGVLWRRQEGGTEVALVHRPRYDDWSLPKGKCKTGELVLITGLREVQEETGHLPRLGPFLGQYSYQLASGGRVATKRVRYWAMEAVDGAFVVNDEVDKLQWMPVDEAQACVSFAIDRKVLQSFGRLPDVSSVLLVIRGGSATGNRRNTARLSTRGRVQAANVTSLLAGVGVTRLISATASCCTAMLTGYGASTGAGLNVDPCLDRLDAVVDIAARLLADTSCGTRSAVCAAGPVVQHLVDELARHGGAARAPHSGLKKGSFCLMHVSSGRVVSIEGQEVTA